jgi:Uma2 family endonuclease
MFMAIERARWTREELARFPQDGNRYEVLHGQLLVTPQPAPDHQFVAARLGYALYGYCELHRAGLAVGPGAVIFGPNELQPDLEVLPIGSDRLEKKWENLPHPLLVVEVLSPFSVSRRRDLSIKKDAYLRLGIGTYWVVDQEARCVHVWNSRESEEIVTDVLRWHPNPVAAPFQITIDELFGPAAG